MSRTAIATRIKAAPARKRRSLRLKLVVISASVIFVTIILSFIFIYSTSSRHLEDEIDNKGLLIVRILASLDDDYWIKAIKRETNYDPFVQIRGKFGYSNVRQISVLFNDPGLPKDPQSVALVPVKVELQNSNVIMTKDGVSIKEGICVTYGDKPLNDFSRTFDFIKKLSGGKELRFWLALSMMDIQKAKND
ncbi:MAG: hypothetical protein HY606_14890, partial [Planctomycetes bacterium]|nr:hypothetical protein [Planctomycetota bacterium]